MRLDLTMQCDECKRQNYRTSRNRDLNDKLALKKFCPSCRSHTLHKERRK